MKHLQSHTVYHMGIHVDLDTYTEFYSHYIKAYVAGDELIGDYANLCDALQDAQDYIEANYQRLKREKGQ